MAGLLPHEEERGLPAFGEVLERRQQHLGLGEGRGLERAGGERLPSVKVGGDLARRAQFDLERAVRRRPDRSLPRREGAGSERRRREEDR